MAADMPLISCVPHFPSFLKGWMRFQIMLTFEHWFFPFKTNPDIIKKQQSFFATIQGHKQKKDLVVACTTQLKS